MMTRRTLRRYLRGALNEYGRAVRSTWDAMEGGQLEQALALGPFERPPLQETLDLGRRVVTSPYRFCTVCTIA
jgi:hypothetical protein